VIRDGDNGVLVDFFADWCKPGHHAATLRTETKIPLYLDRN